MCIASETQLPMFCSLLLRRECCSFSNGEYVKAGLHELEQWCVKATDQVTGLSKCEFLQYKECQVQDDQDNKMYLNYLVCSFLDHHGMNSNT